MKPNKTPSYRLQTLCSAVIVAAGAGKRMGQPKQFLDICGKPLLFHSIETFLSLRFVKSVVVVINDEGADIVKQKFSDKRLKFAGGGSTRLLSVINGVAAVDKTAEIIIVHDGARPFVKKETIISAVKKAEECGASVCAVKVKNTVKQADKSGRFVAKTLDRNCLYSAQTPQCYKAKLLRNALKKYGRNVNATDESQLMEKTGIKPAIVLAEEENIKVTTPADLKIARVICGGEDNVRCGIGYDVHRMQEGRPLIIAGIEIAHSKGLLGHSDGDVVLHAVCDGALGAMALGEIGMFFPPTDLTIMGISSKAIAEKAVQTLKGKNARIIRIDATIVAEEPKISPHYKALRKSLCDIFSLDMNNVSVKAKSKEGIGDIGAGRAMECTALVTVKCG